MSVDSVRLSRVTALLSGLFAVGLAFLGYVVSSQLAWAQAADSVVDFAGALVLAWVVKIAQRPRDADHPWGHSRAEPLGALGVAMLAAVLAVQVALGAVGALTAGSHAIPSRMLVALFVSKVVFKGIIYSLCRRAPSPALRALGVDARNDVLVGFVSVVGYLGLLLGFDSWDAILALPVAIWIGWSGVALARENIDLLMGAAPSQERISQLLALAREVQGVLGVHDLRAQHLGAQLAIHVHVTVQADLSVAQGHDIGEAVRRRLEREADVSSCAVHVDPG
jgi:ferrous-iron efflux pump FieF